MLHINSYSIYTNNEIHLDANILDAELVDNSYSVFRRDRNRQGGEVMIITSNTLPITRRHDLETRTLEILWVEISLHPKPILLGLFYRPPSSKDNLEELQHVLNSISSQRVILCGDFNMPDIVWHSISCTSSHIPSSSFCEISKNCALEQLVIQPTRQNNIQDLVLTTHPHLVIDVQVVEEQWPPDGSVRYSG